MIKKLFNKYFELVFWAVALASLALSNPSNQSHYSLCPLKLLGITWCPGCGMGHAISYFFHGNISASFHTHWLGIPAVFILMHRVYALVIRNFKAHPQFN